MSDWGALLNGAFLSGCGEVPEGCETTIPDPLGILSRPPEGLGLPNIRSQDTSYPQRDGVRHHDDWYEARIVTLEATVCPSDCPNCPSARAALQELIMAWSRQCNDVELAIFTDCHGEDDTVAPEEGSPLTGPFGIIGRPRRANYVWPRGRSGCASVTLRFDAIDHRMFILDECGTPGSGEKCETLLAGSTATNCRAYDRCYTTGTEQTWCYDQSTGDTEGSTTTATSNGTLCAYPEITLHSTLTEPFIENLTTGEVITYNGSVALDEAPVIIDTYEGTATQDGNSRTHLLGGTTRWTLQPGDNDIRLVSFGGSDDGTAEVCWRDSVANG